jgi:molybdopterin-guanine dinucleotide biosynthesis protein A
MTEHDHMISCIILAGGRARRMQGEDKGLLSFRGRPLIEHVIDRVKPQVDQIIISANRNTERYACYSDLVIADQNPDFSGPLAGIASCLPHCQHALTLVVACDMPQLPQNLVVRLSSAIHEHEIAIASCELRQQLALLLKTSLLDSINRVLANNDFKFLDWIDSRDTVAVEYTDTSAFINLNTLSDLGSVS